MRLLLPTAAFVLTSALMPVLIAFSRRWGLLDRPGALKVHERPVPVLGGIGIFLGVLVPSAVLAAAGAGSARVLALLGVALALVALGAWDDLRQLGPGIRLAGHVVVALAAVGLGLRMETLPGALVGVPLTVVLVVGAINTVNLFDGLDGLAGGTVCVSLAGFAVVLGARGDDAFTALALTALGAVAGFLLFNFNPARIFMGDNGSTFLGFLLGVLAARVASRPHDLRSLALALLLIGLPIVDTFVAIARRAIRRRPIFLGDRSHIYDQLVDRGLSVRRTALLCWGVQLLLVTIALTVRAGEP